MKIQIVGKITSETLLEAKDVLDYFATTYGSQIKAFSMPGTGVNALQTSFSIEVTTAVELRDAIVSLIQQYDTRFIDWNYQLDEI